MLLAVVLYPIIINCCTVSEPEYFLGWVMINVSLLSAVFNSRRNLVCKRSELDEELLLCGKVPAGVRSPPREDVEMETPVFATVDNVPVDAMSGRENVHIKLAEYPFK